MKRTILITGFLALAMLISACGLSVPTVSALNEPETVFEPAEPSDKPMPEPAPEPTMQPAWPSDEPSDGPETVFEESEPAPEPEPEHEPVVITAEGESHVFANDEAEDWLPTLPSVDGLYPLCAYVYDLVYDEDIVVVNDGAGILWGFYGIEDYAIGDIVALIMGDNGTPDYIYDDIIICARYGGFSVN